ncbi:hypothetical protein G3N96_23890, partial [Burkholderia sp. Se-20373]|nr:hypothetical protein [Burkholderia sp. Se-20373]
ARFDAKYLPADPALAHGAPGAYRNRPAVVLARRMDEPFTIARAENGDTRRGAGRRGGIRSGRRAPSPGR